MFCQLNYIYIKIQKERTNIIARKNNAFQCAIFDINKNDATGQWVKSPNVWSL